MAVKEEMWTKQKRPYAVAAWNDKHKNDNNIIQKSGSWFSYDGQKLGQGRDAVKQLMKDNPELCEELEAKVVETIKNEE